MYIEVKKENIDLEHICCAISSKDSGVKLKKAWLNQQFDKGLVFRKLDQRGKVFIEYIPAENAYVPIKADGYLYINCFWVSGKFKKQGHGKALLESAIRDAKEKGKKGLVVLSSKKKKPFLSDKKYLLQFGFEVADVFGDYELLHLTLQGDVQASFKTMPPVEGNQLYYTHQCPHTDKYAKLIKEVADREKFPLDLVHLDTLEAAQNAPCPFTTFTLFLNGQLITNEILTEKKFLQIIEPLR